MFFVTIMKKLFSKIKFPQLPTPNSQLRTDSGLTFIELIVVAAIFSILAAVSLFRFGGFTANISIQNVTQDIALKLVQAQREGSSGSYPRFINPLQATLLPTAPTPWTPAYGIHFFVPVGGVSTEFFYFFDRGPFFGIEHKYDGGTSCDGTDECIDKITINSGDTIVGLCVETTILCVSSSDGTFVSGQVVDNLDVAFKRPNLSAIIHGYDTTGGDIVPFTSITAGKISVRSKDNEHYKIITVYPVGQITVE